MNTLRFKAGQWIITESGTPAYFIYKMTKGSVSYHEEGAVIRIGVVKEGMKPIYLGFTGALRDDRRHSTSIRAETDVELEVLSVDSLRGTLKHDIRETMRRDIAQMIRASYSKTTLGAWREKRRRSKSFPTGAL
jgi:CRP-like cAMP-binding protein